MTQKLAALVGRENNDMLKRGSPAARINTVFYCILWWISGKQQHVHTWGLLSSVRIRWSTMSVQLDWLLGEWCAAVAWVIVCQAPLAVFGRCMACENWKTGNNSCWETQEDRCEDWWLNDLDRYQTRTGRFDVWYRWLTDCTSLTQARLLLSAKSGPLHSIFWQEIALF